MFLGAAALVAAVVLTGCGGDVPRGRVHGTIKHQGKPLKDATLIFVASDNKTHSAQLKPDGTFEVSGVAYGPVKASIQPLLPRSAVKADPDPKRPQTGKAGVVDEKASFKPPEDQPKAPHFLAQYTDAEKSGLTFELKQSDQEWSVDLK
jgi:hypothetical protein